MGLDKPALMELIGAMFPDLMSAFAGVLDDPVIVIDAEEQSVRDILGMFSTGAGRLERYLAAVIARRCKSPHHLWQDLGLHDRDELSRLMKRHFARLAERNQHNMKWKKFLYRMVCRSEGFSLCTAPVCSECSDFDSCFGAEDGESRLARVAHAHEEAA
jgi:nitrogen fixation protein NifQ